MHDASHVIDAAFVSKFTKATAEPPSASFFDQICWHAGTESLTRPSRAAYSSSENVGQLSNTGVPCTLHNAKPAQRESRGPQIVTRQHSTWGVCHVDENNAITADQARHDDS